MIVIGIDYKFLNHDFRVYHNHLYGMHALSRYVNIYAEPAQIVKHLAAHPLTAS